MKTATEGDCSSEAQTTASYSTSIPTLNHSLLDVNKGLVGELIRVRRPSTTGIKALSIKVDSFILSPQTSAFTMFICLLRLRFLCILLPQKSARRSIIRMEKTVPRRA